MNKKSILLLFSLLLLAALAACAAPGSESAAAEVDSITLERQPCFGFCPVYTLTIHGDGEVHYNGLNFVEVTGEQTSQIDPAAVQALADEMAAAGYFDWADEYLNQEVTDHPYVITSITLADGTTKQINHYHGDFSAPEALTALEDRIDEVAGSAQWVGEPQP